MDAAFLHQLTGILVPIGICVVLPVLCVWLVMRAKINKDNANKEVLIAAINRNSGIEIEQFVEKLSPRGKNIKERLLTKLLWALICLVSGFIVLAAGIYLECAGKGGDDAIGLAVFGGCILSTGIAFLVVFLVGRRTLAKEIETEEKQKIQK